MNEESLRRNARYWSVWPTVWLSVAIAIVVFIAQNAVMIAALPPIDPHLSDEESSKLIKAVAQSGTVVSLAVIFAAFCGCAAITFAIQLKQGAKWPEYLSLKRMPPATFVRWLVLSAALLGLADLVTISLDRQIVQKFDLDFYLTTEPRWLVWIALVLFAPVLEEALFRGFMFRGLSTSWLANSGAILVTSLVWAALHYQYDLYVITQVFLLGVLLGVARVRTGSLYMPLTIHIVSNFISALECAIAASN